MFSVRSAAIVGACGVCVAGAWGDVRTMDGSGNNVAHPDWGQAGTGLMRGLSGAHYLDGIGLMRPLPNPRMISNAVSAQVAPVGNARGLSSMHWQWGQFIDHDFALVPTGTSESAPIEVPLGDPVFDPDGVGGRTIEFLRSAYLGGSGKDPRVQPNVITHWIDGSMVYGSDDARGAALREGTGGRLVEGPDAMLPFNTMGLPNGGGPSPSLRVAGDVRCNEQTGLAAIHTIFVREHNFWAGRIHADHPDWSDEQVYQHARKMVGGIVQAITYNEWLPALLGPHCPPSAHDYDPAMFPSLDTTFSTAAFRLGHTMLNEQLLRFNEDGSVYPGGHLTLAQTFFNPGVISGPSDLEAVMRGLARQEANEIDPQAVDSVRNMLFGEPGPGARDLIAINLQRGRDHGIPGYNDVRRDFGLPPRPSIEEITSDLALRKAIGTAYAGEVEQVDAWIGLLAEDHLDGASVGETLAAILRDQFVRLRDGDRMFYTNDAELSPDEIAEIDRTTLAIVIRRNSRVQAIQDQVFFAEQVCPCDWNDDGTTDSADFFAFLTCFLGGDCPVGHHADFNADGMQNSQDFFDYLNCFFAGCA